VKIKYLVTHPIQYQQPLLKFLYRLKKNNFQTLFISDFSIKDFFDDGFSKKIKWDKNLLEGYNSKILNKNQAAHYSYFKPFCFSLIKILIKDKPDIIVIHGWGQINLISGLILSKILKSKIILRSENIVQEKMNFFKKIICYFYYKFILFFPDIYLSIGKENAKFYKKYGWNKKIYTSYYTVDIKNIKVLSNDEKTNKNIKKSIDKDKRFKFFFLGKLIDRKNPMVILNSIKLLNKNYNNYSFYIIGDGELKIEMENYCKKNDIKNIYFIGFLNTKEFPSIVKRLDCFIFSSKNENWGLVLNEIMALGKPSICSDAITAAKDLIINGKNGYIFKSNDHFDLRDKMALFLNGEVNFKNLQENTSIIINKYGFKQNITEISKIINEYS
jgi:glycosyltransferase involved in cell wall biosynthesis